MSVVYERGGLLCLDLVFVEERLMLQRCPE